MQPRIIPGGDGAGAGYLFVFIGAAPGPNGSTGSWPDDKGFRAHGPDLMVDGRRPRGWNLDRDPYYLEASAPGIFAAGDVRAGSVKRVASAVGEGAMAIQLLHSVPGAPVSERTRLAGAGGQRIQPQPRAAAHLFLFEHLDDDQLAWLIERGRLVEYPAGGDHPRRRFSASCFLVLLSGTMSMSKRVQGGELELFRTDYRGAYTGAFNAVVPIEASSSCTRAPLAASPLAACSRFRPTTSARPCGSGSRWPPTCWPPDQGATASEIVERHERLVALGAVTAGSRTS